MTGPLRKVMVRGLEKADQPLPSNDGGLQADAIEIVCRIAPALRARSTAAGRPACAPVSSRAAS